MAKIWYKFLAKLFGSILLIRLGVVLQDCIFSRYYIEYSTKKGEFKLRSFSDRNRPRKTKTKKTEKNPIGFETTGIKG